MVHDGQSNVPNFSSLLKKIAYIFFCHVKQRLKQLGVVCGSASRPFCIPGPRLKEAVSI